MSNNPGGRRTVAVIFGSQSVEHDVSIVTAQQVIRALDPAKYEVVPIYITREGKWLSGAPLSDLNTFKNEDVSELMGVKPTTITPSTEFAGMITPPMAGYFGKNTFRKIDVVFPCVHGSHGEDGTLQGLLELANIPYVGCGVLASAVANDKITCKAVLKEAGIRVVDSMSFRREDWSRSRADVLVRMEELGYPLFIKPATLGSSIGISRPKEATEAAAGIDLALSLDRRVLVERAMTGAMEINCSVIGNMDIKPSVLEQPISFDEFLTYEEKYLHGGANKGMKGADRQIPAPIPASLTQEIRDIAVRAFRAIDGRGIARMDFLVKDGEVYLNEINTLPGSLSFYLWQETPEWRLSPAMVCDELIRIAFEAHADKRRTVYSHKTRLVAQAARGMKGMKGMKYGVKTRGVKANR